MIIFIIYLFIALREKLREKVLVLIQENEEGEKWDFDNSIKQQPKNDMCDGKENEIENEIVMEVKQRRKKNHQKIDFVV